MNITSGQDGILKVTVHILFPIHLDQIFDTTMLFEAKNELLKVPKQVWVC
jgi:hypothetical protein